MRITVLSTFDIWPARDGGQMRYVNLWRNFSRAHEITIIVYDFRNTAGERRYRIADHVEVVVPPAAEGDVRHFHHLLARTSLWIHDILCLSDYMFSSEFLTVLARHASTCDVLVASHPYLAGVAFPMAPSRALRVYESYNVEADIKQEYLAGVADRDLAARYLHDVQFGERSAAVTADHVTAVSAEDRLRLIELYGLPAAKVSIVPNGSNIPPVDLLTASERAEARDLLGLGGREVGIFLGSSFKPNVVSYERTRSMLKQGGFRGTVLLVGSIKDAPRADWPDVPFEERWLGFVDAGMRELLLRSADFALQTMFAGAGTNLKLFDYMGAGVPIIANGFGRRGVDHDGWCWEVETATDLMEAIADIEARPDEALSVAAEARRIALTCFHWQAIALSFERSMTTSFKVNTSKTAFSRDVLRGEGTTEEAR